jgi:hypothetical protein
MLDSEGDTLTEADRRRASGPALATGGFTFSCGEKAVGSTGRSMHRNG